MLEKVNNLKIWQKLGLLVLLMGIPVTVLGYLFVASERRAIGTLDNEENSLAYFVPVRQLFQHMALHRGLTARVLSGDSSARSQLLALAPAIESDLTTIDAFEAKNGKTFGTTQNVSAIHQSWAEIKQKGNAITAKENFDLHGKLIATSLDLMRIIGDTGLIIDGQLQTYYMAINLVLQLPSTIENMGQMRAVGAGVLNRQKITEEERQLLTANSAVVRLLASRTRTGLSTALQGDTALEAKVSPSFLAAMGAVDVYLQAINDGVIKSQSLDSKEYFASATDAIDSMFRLYDTVLTSFQESVDLRARTLRRDMWLQISGALLALLLAIGLAYFVSGAVTKQVNAITTLFSNIGMGDFKARTEITSQDELGVMAESLNAMLDSVLSLIQSRDERDRIQQSIQKLLEDISVVADGDLTAQAHVTTEVTGAIADSFNNMIEELRQIISRVQETTLSVSSSATEVQTTAEHLATGSESQSMQIVEASAAIDEMAVSIQQVSANAVAAATVAELALKNAKQGSESVTKTITGMNGIRQQVQQTAKRIKRLGESSQEIGEIVQLIGDIADRTSILALNASIQAAMAGDAGKGFAVVAEEVERLAERSTEATKKIGSLIKSIQSDTNEAIAAMEDTTKEVVGGSSLANEAGQKLQEIEAVSNQLAEIIQSISMASKQQTRGSDSVAKSMSEISGVTQQTAAGAKQAAVSIRKLAELADDLRGEMKKFKLPKVAA
jgi:methyl-accepting chemotaxis protein